MSLKGKVFEGQFINQSFNIHILICSIVFALHLSSHWELVKKINNYEIFRYMRQY